MIDVPPLPDWAISFDKNGATDQTERASLVEQIAGAGLADLIIMSHGWNNDVDTARVLYQEWFAMLPTLLSTTARSTVGTLGIYWPSMLWPDEPPPPVSGGAADLAPAAPVSTPGACVDALAAVYEPPEQRAILSELAQMLNDKSPDPSALDHFHALMVDLANTELPRTIGEDDGPTNLLTSSPQALASRFAAKLDEATSVVGLGARTPGGADDGGAAGLLGGGLSGVWDGMKEALRQLTYWQMKGRAGTVGQVGLGPFLSTLQARAPSLRIHLIGHSFGARLVSFSLLGLRAGAASPVASLTLLEGAFSHFAFATQLPAEMSRPSGALNGMAARVSGPLLACYSSHDLALSIFYPAASMAAGDDAADLVDDVTYRWGGMGHDGAQRMEATIVNLGDTAMKYAFVPGQFTNVDASAFVRNGGLPSGAHGDIFHPELAWALLSAAGLV